MESSIVDYVFRLLGMRFLSDDEQQKVGIDRELSMQHMIDGGSALSEQIATAVKEAIEEDREEHAAPVAAAPAPAPVAPPAPRATTKEPTTLAERIARNAGQSPQE